MLAHSQIPGVGVEGFLKLLSSSLAGWAQDFNHCFCSLPRSALSSDWGSRWQASTDVMYFL